MLSCEGLQMNTNNQLSTRNYKSLLELFLECKEITLLIILELEYSQINQFKIVEGRIQADRLVVRFLNLFRDLLDN